MNPLLQKTADANNGGQDGGIFVLLNSLVYGRGKKRLGWQWAKQIDPEAEKYLDSLDFTQDGFKLVTTTDHQFTRGRAQIGEFNGWNLSRDAEQEQALQKLWVDGQSIWRSPLDKTAKSGPHKNSSVQINVPSAAAAKMSAAANRIPDEELGADGRENDFHITCKYGVKDDADLLSRVVNSQKPFNITLGKMHVFEASESSDGQAPVVVQAHSPELEPLHDAVDKAMGSREDDFPEYKPHITLAYVKQSIASKYEGLDWVEGVSFQVNAVTLSRGDGARTPVPFGQPKTGSHKTPPMSDTQYEPSGEYGQGQETNAYADIPERVKGEEDLPSLEALSPDLFKQAYADQSANLPLRGQKGIGGQDFPVLEEEEVFPKAAAGASTSLMDDEEELLTEAKTQFDSAGKSAPKLERVPLFSEEKSPDIVKESSDYPHIKTAQEPENSVASVFYIEVPSDVRDSFWREPPEGKLEFWAFKGRPSVLPNETIYFTFDKVPVGETTVYKVEPPGQSACGATGLYLDHWKLSWLPSAFKKYASIG